MADSTALEIIIEAKDKATEVFDDIKGSMAKVGVAAAAVGGAITAAMMSSVKAAGEAQVKMASVNATLATMGDKGKQAKDGILQAASAAVKLGFDDEEAAVSITKLYQRTGDLTEAMNLNQVAMDLSRAKNIDLSTASGLVGMVLSGNGRILKQYQIDLKDSATPLEALGELQQKVSGQAAEASKTWAVQNQVLTIQMENLKERIGEALLPILTRLLEAVVPIIEKVIAWTEAHPKLTETIVIVTAAVGALLVVLPAIVAFIVAITSTIGLWVIAIGVVGAAIVAFTVLIVTNWTRIKNTVHDAIEEIKILWSDAVTFLVTGWKAGWQAIGDALTSVWETIKNTIKDSINWIIDKINWFITKANQILDKAGGIVGVKVPDLGTIPKLAEGGIVTKPTLALIGEAGPEAVVPLNSSNRAAAGMVVNVTVNGDISGEELVEKIGNQLVRFVKLSTATV